MTRPSQAAIALLTVLATACGVPSEGGIELLDPSEYVVEVRPTTVVTTAPMSPRLDGVLVYFVRDTGLRARVTLAPEDFGISDIITALANGPESSDTAGGLRSSVTDRRSLVVDHDVRDSVAYVELDASFGDLPGSEQILFLGQVTLSIVGNNLAESVLYTIGGEPIAVPDADGTPISTPTERKNYVDLITR